MQEDNKYLVSMRRNLEITIPPDDETITIFVFAKHIFWGWCGLMIGGIIGASFVVWGVFGSLPAIVVGLVSIIAIFIACYYLWTAERVDKLSIIEAKDNAEISLTKKVEKLENDLKIIKADKYPKLFGFFQDLMAYPLKPLGDGSEYSLMKSVMAKPIGTTIVVRIGFVNESAISTTIHGFRLTVKTSDGKIFTANYSEEITKVIQKMKRKGNVFFDPEIEEIEKEKGINLDIYLDNQSRVAEQGKRVEGFLVFKVKDLMFEDFNASGITLTITDAWNNGHQIVSWGNPPRPYQMLGYPYRE